MTRARWWRPTSRDRRRDHVAGDRRRAGARRDLRPDGGGNRPRVRRAPARQLRLRAADHGGRVRARSRGRAGLAPLGRDRALLRGRARALVRDGAARLPAAALPVAGGDARRHVRRRVPAPVDRVALVRPARQDRGLVRGVEPARDDPRRRRAQDHDRGDRRCRRLPRRAAAPSGTDRDRATHAGGGDGLPDRAADRRRREPGDRRRGADLRPAGRRDRGAVDGADAARDAGLRAARHDRRPCRRRARRHEPAAQRDARRLCDRLRLRPARRRAPDRPEPVPALVPLRRGHPRPAGTAERPLRAQGRRGGAAGMRWSYLTAPAALIALTGLIGSLFERSTEIYVINTLVALVVVVALYLFVGNSGVVSFGHVAFVAVGAWTAGVLTIPAEEKSALLPSLFPWLAERESGNVLSLLAAAVVGAVFAALVGLPLMRLSGLAAGIATFGVLEITHNVLRYYEKIGPGTTAFSAVPETTDLLQATIGGLIAVLAAFTYQNSRFGRQLRATREDPAAARAVGISVYRQRLLSFALSGAVAGFAGRLADRRRGRADGARPDPAPERAHRRPRAAAAAAEDCVRVCIVGCGAVGSLFAANLASLDDVEVWAYDLARDHVDAINEGGLRLTGAGDVHATEIRATADASELPACDFGIVATKAMHTEAAIAATAHAFADGAVASVQNGVGNEEAIAPHVARVIRGTTFPAGKIVEPGVVQWDVKGDTTFGPFEPSPASREEIERLAEACTRGGMPTSAVEDARGAQWRKVIFNASTNPIGALTGLTHGRVCERPELRRLVSRLVDEGKAVAHAQGIVLDADPEALIDHAAKPEVAYGHKASMLQDVEARRLTEVDWLNGGIVRFGREHGVPTPLNQAVVALIKGVEASWTLN